MADSSSQSTHQSFAGSVFVGREGEFSELKAALEEALTGHGRLVMLLGEPGIGKTRTAQELASYAENRGAQVLWGWCYEDEGAPSYWPWVQAIGSYIQQIDSGRLRSETGLGAGSIAEMLPNIREKLPDLDDPPPLEPEQARFRLFESITNFLKTASRTQPLVIVLDDLHWADHASLLLLEFLARAMAPSNLLIVGTYRDVEVSRQHPLSQTLGSLMREQLFRRIQLGGLSQQEVHHLAELSAGVAFPDDALEIVHRRTEGNPLFVSEIVRIFSQGEIATDPGWVATVPEGIRDAIGRRLNRLSKECNQVLTTAAVVGRQFDLALLEMLSLDFSEDQLLGLLDEALTTGVLEEVRLGAGRFQFQHALIQETLISELSAARQVRLHARIGEALEGLYAADVEAHATELAHHFAEAEPLLGAEKLVRYSLTAGEQALAAYAWEEALSIFERALAAREGQTMDGDRAALLYGLGRSEAAMSAAAYDRTQAYSSMKAAFDFYIEAGDMERAVAIAEDRAFTGAPGGGLHHQVRAHALSLVPPDSLAEGRLLCHYATDIYHETADYAGANESFDRAIAIARREGDTALEARTLAEHAHVDTDEFLWEQGLEKSLQAIALSPQSEDPVTDNWARRAAFDALSAMGDFEAAKVHAEAAPASNVGMPQRNRTAAFHIKMAAAYRCGDWQAARTLCDQALAVAPWFPVLLALRAQLEYEAGEFGVGASYLERLVESMRRTNPGPTQPFSFTAMAIAETSRIAGSTDRFEEAENAAEIVLSSPNAIPRFAFCARTGLALIAIQRGDATAAAEQYAALDRARGTFMLAVDASSVPRRLGLLSQTMGDLEQAVKHFEEALALCRQTDYRPELAWTCYDYAGALIVGAHGRAPLPGGLERVSSLLEEARSIATALGMRPLMEWVAARQQELTAQPSIEATHPDGLTQREVEVLRLISSGKNNREISDELVISLLTVAHHVTSILSKTGSANRTEAAGYAARQGLITW